MSDIVADSFGNPLPSYTEHFKGAVDPAVRIAHLEAEIVRLRSRVAELEGVVRDELTAESERLGLYDEPVLTNWTVQDVRD